MQKELRFGVFGVWRGLDHVMALEVLDGVIVTAVCDKDPERIKAAQKHCPPDVRTFSDYDEMLNSGLIDAVVLCNYLPDHASAAIKALHKGIAVVSECLAAATMKECVELVEAVEQTGVYYSLAENYPFFSAVQEMQRVYRSGVIGDVVYAEGEYCHPRAPEMAGKFAPTKDHWRKQLPKTYYVTHSMGPLMNITGLMPKKVIGKVAAGESYARRRGRKNGDSAGIMLVEMEGGVLFRVTGCSSYSPETHWFRLAGTNGGVENDRMHTDAVCLAIDPWDQPKELHAFGSKTYYVPPYDEIVNQAAERGLRIEGHMDADVCMVNNYVREIREGRAPDMDVYRACAMSAVAILGWRSVLNDSKQYDIPDFRDPAARDAFRSDDLSPFRGEIPFCIHSLD